eukprot:403371850
MYGQKIQFTYKGKKSYKTSVGSFFTVITRLLILFFIGYESYLLYTKKFPLTFTKYFVRDINDPSVYPKLNGFDIAFGVNKQMDTSYGMFTARQINQRGAYQNKTVQSRSIPIGNCGTKQFYKGSQQEQANYGIQDFQCLLDDYVELKGNSISSDVYSYVEIQLIKCQNSTTYQNGTATCKSQQQIDSYFDDMDLQVVFVNSNFNFNVQNSPLEFYIDDQLSMIDLESNREKKINMFIQQASSLVYGNIIIFWEYITEKFVRVENIKISEDTINQSTKALATIKIQLDRRNVQFGIIIDNLIVTLEKVGGFKGAMFSLGFLFVAYFQERLFKSSFFKQIYQVKEPTAEEKMRERKNSDGEVNNSKATIKIDDTTHMDGRISSRQEINESQEAGDPQDFLNRLFSQARMTVKDVNMLLEEVLSRKRFRYGVYNTVHYILRCVCCRKPRQLKQKLEFKQHFFYHKANKKIEQELDVVNLVRSIRKLKLMAKVILSQRSRYLLKFQRKNVLESLSSSSDSDDHQYDPMKLINNKNQLVKLSAIQKIKKNLNFYSENIMDHIDKNLVKGLYLKKQREINDAASDNERVMSPLYMRFGSQYSIAKSENNSVPTLQKPPLNIKHRMIRMSATNIQGGNDYDEFENETIQVQSSAKRVERIAIDKQWELGLKQLERMESMPIEKINGPEFENQESLDDLNSQDRRSS